MDDPKDGGGAAPDDRDVLRQQRADRHRRQEPGGLQARHRHRQLDGARPHAQCRSRPGSSTTPAAPAARRSARSSPRRLHRAVRGHDRRQRGHLVTSRRRPSPPRSAGCSTARRRPAPSTPNGPTGLAWQFDWNIEDARRRRLRGRRRGVRRLRRLRARAAQETVVAQPLRRRARPSRSPAAAPSSARSRSSGRRTPSATSSATRSSASGPRRRSARSPPRSSTPSAPTRARRPTRRSSTTCAPTTGTPERQPAARAPTRPTCS